MKTLSAAFAITMGIIAIVYLVLVQIGVEQSAAGSIVSALVGCVPFVREGLEKAGSRAPAAPSPSVLSLGRFGVPAARVVLYGTLMLVAVMQAAGVIGMLVSSIINNRLDFDGSAFVPTLSLVVYLTVYPAAFLIGRWVGRRSARYGLLSVFLIALLGRTLTTAIDALLVPGDFEKILQTFFGSGSMASNIAWQIISGTVLFSVVGALGYWRGRRQRLGSYLGYLLKNVPEPARLAIVDLAFEEADRVWQKHESGSVAPKTPLGVRAA